MEGAVSRRRRPSFGVRQPGAGQKLRWCPETGAGAKKLATAGQKLRWCPEIGAGTEKMSRSGQKSRWCPETGAGTEKLATAGQKLRWCPCFRAGAKKLTTANYSTWRCSTAAFSFHHKAAAYESIGSSRTGDTCGGALEIEHNSDSCPRLANNCAGARNQGR